MVEIKFSEYLHENFGGAEKVDDARVYIDRRRGYLPKHVDGKKCELAEWLCFQLRDAASYLLALSKSNGMLQSHEVEALENIRKANNTHEGVGLVKELSSSNQALLERLLAEYVAEEAAMLCKLFGVPIETAATILEPFHEKIAGAVQRQRYLYNEKLAQSGRNGVITPVDVLDACPHKGLKVVEHESGLLTVEAQVVVPSVTPDHPAETGEPVEFDLSNSTEIPLRFEGEKR